MTLSLLIDSIPVARRDERMNKIKTCWQYLVPKLGITRFFGYLANRPNSPFVTKMIKKYIQHFEVNMEEAIETDISQYASFNDFFIRQLKPECRPLATQAIVSPADGCFSEIGNIQYNHILQAKGFDYSLSELLGNHPMSGQFINGTFATIYLSPRDYHRVHMPCDATLTEMRYIPGDLFSVNQATARSIDKLFARNERLAIFFDTSLGPMAMIMVGAINVASIGTTWQGDIPRQKEIRHWKYPNPKLSKDKLSMAKGAEMGYFKLGSTVILLFSEEANIKWCKNHQAGSAIKMGEALID